MGDEIVEELRNSGKDCGCGKGFPNPKGYIEIDSKHIYTLTSLEGRSTGKESTHTELAKRRVPCWNCDTTKWEDCTYCCYKQDGQGKASRGYRKGPGIWSSRARRICRRCFGHKRVIVSNKHKFLCPKKKFYTLKTKKPYKSRMYKCPGGGRKPWTAFGCAICTNGEVNFTQASSIPIEPELFKSKFPGINMTKLSKSDVDGFDCRKFKLCVSVLVMLGAAAATCGVVGLALPTGASVYAFGAFCILGAHFMVSTSADTWNDKNHKYVSADSEIEKYQRLESTGPKSLRRRRRLQALGVPVSEFWKD